MLIPVSWSWCCLLGFLRQRQQGQQIQINAMMNITATINKREPNVPPTAPAVPVR